MKNRNMIRHLFAGTLVIAIAPAVAMAWNLETSARAFLFGQGSSGYGILSTALVAAALATVLCFAILMPLAVIAESVTSRRVLQFPLALVLLMVPCLAFSALGWTGVWQDWLPVIDGTRAFSLWLAGALPLFFYWISATVVDLISLAVGVARGKLRTLSGSES